jgi:hypothetical protein
MITWQHPVPLRTHEPLHGQLIVGIVHATAVIWPLGLTTTFSHFRLSAHDRPRLKTRRRNRGKIRAGDGAPTVTLDELQTFRSKAMSSGCRRLQHRANRTGMATARSHL